MTILVSLLRESSLSFASVRTLVVCAALTCGLAVAAQSPPISPSETSGAAAPAATNPPAPAPVPSLPSSSKGMPQAKESKAELRTITDEEIKQRLVGKTLYLRGGFLDNALHFDQRGNILSSSPKGSFTLSLVQIDKVHVEKRKVELEGSRYGVHFLESLPGEDPLETADKVKITPKKKALRIVIDRVEPDTKKEKKAPKAKKGALPPPPPALAVAAAPAVDPNKALDDAIDNVFSRGLDTRMLASLPDFWQSYLQRPATGSSQPRETMYRQNAVDKKARLVSAFQPPSNEYAQSSGVAGIASYRVVIGSNGQPGEITVGRPIGFGLDENAVASIRKASFEPAMKDGKPVPVTLDLIVQFRIYSQRTGTAAPAEPEKAEADKPGPALPGPYSVGLPQETAKPAQDNAPPAQNTTKTDQDSAKPAQDSAKPLQDGSTPAQDTSTPSQDSATPVQDNAKPAQDTAKPQ